MPCRTWCLTLTYGFCFGIELTINNIIAAYLFDQFGVSLTIAGLIGSLFGAPCFVFRLVHSDIRTV